MAVKQLSVFIENRHGMLAEICSALASAGIDIRALSLAETPDYGILRLIVSDTDKAYETVRSTGRSAKINHVLGLRVDDRPGGLSAPLSLLTEAGFDVEYMYAFIGENKDFADVVMRVKDTAAAEALLRDKGYTLID
jgi:hypothetical protein